MPKRDTSVTIKIHLLIEYSTRSESQALNATQGQKHDYQNSATNTVFNQDHESQKEKK